MNCTIATQPGVLQAVPERRLVFISYSHADCRWVERLKRSMAPLVRSGLSIRLWDDSQIEPGRKWREQIETALAQAKVALLLVSDHFLASEFVMGEEVPKLLAAAEAEGVRVLWVSLTACLVEQTEIYQYQAVLPPSRPLDKMAKADANAALKAIGTAIQTAMHSLPNEVPIQWPDPRNLDTSWEVVLTHVELPSSRTLFSQQTKLLSLDSERAVVGVSGTWLAMVQSRLPLLENAMTQASGSSRTLILQPLYLPCPLPCSLAFPKGMLPIWFKVDPQSPPVAGGPLELDSGGKVRKSSAAQSRPSRHPHWHVRAMASGRLRLHPLLAGIGSPPRQRCKVFSMVEGVAGCGRR